MLQIRNVKVTATPGATGWVQAYSFFSPDKEIERIKGNLYIVISSIKSEEGIEAISDEREIASKINNEYYKSTQEKPFNALNSITQNIFSEFKNKDSGLEIACCVYVQGIFYTSAAGGAKIMLFRDGTLVPILESKFDVITASGLPKKGDVIIAGTKSFFGKIDPQTLKIALGKGINSTVEEITPFLFRGDENGTAGASLIDFGDASILENNLSSQVMGTNGIAPGVSTSAASIEHKFLQKTSGFISRLFNRVPKRNIYIKPGIQDEAVSQNRKLTFSIGIILLVILAISIGLGISQKKKNDLKKTYQALLAEASNEVTQAITLASTNAEESRSLFADSESKLSQIKALKVKDDKITELENKIDESRAAVLGEYVANPEMFFDLGLLSSGFKGNTISYSGGNIYVLDKSGAKIVSISMDTKKSKVVSGPSVISSPKDVASYEDNVYVLLDDGIYLTSATKTKVVDKTWNGDAQIYAFAGNLYVLDKSAGQIYRYAGGSGNTFGSQQNWLSSSTKADFSNALGWGMNGAVYVLYQNSKILKYSLGSPQSFSVKGVQPEIGNIDAIFADSDNTYVYLLDRAGKRVVAVDKDGRYKFQYLSDDFSGAINLVVSESEKKIILLTGDKLLSIDLKNI